MSILKWNLFKIFFRLNLCILRSVKNSLILLCNKDFFLVTLFGFLVSYDPLYCAKVVTVVTLFWILVTPE